MKLEQELELQELLKQWREERHLTVESQRDGLMGNLCEEMTEYYRATNNDEKIDALCDMYVFCMNSMNTSIRDIPYDTFTELGFYRFSNVFECMPLLERTLKSSYGNGVDFVSREILKLLDEEMRVLHYNPYKCMLETIQEISSRTGHYDENIHKFIKDKSDEAKAKWYKADYESCKIKG